ncbi:MAG: MATE family efflux transporter, partial [Bacillota bacterium]|nr:MATE family efflux transporter [Bacillota bacterium]
MLNSSTLTETRYDGKLVVQMFKELLPVQILSSVVPYLASIANGVVVGNALSAEAIIALGLVSPMTNLFGAIASIIAGGAKILSGRYIGRGEHDKLNNVFSCALMAAFFIGVILTVGVFIFANPIAVLLGAKEIATAETTFYIRGIALGIIPTLMIPSFTVFLQMGNESTYALLATVLLAASNLVGDILCVKVIGGGMFAIGIATAISQFIAIAFLVIRFIQKEDLMKFSVKYFIKSLTKDLIILGSPTAIAILLYAIRNAIFNIQVIKWGGEIAASANSIVNLMIGPFDGINVGVGATVLMLA